MLDICDRHFDHNWLQETPRNNLKKTIKFEIKLDKVKPLVTQVQAFRHEDKSIDYFVPPFLHCNGL